MLCLPISSAFAESISEQQLREKVMLWRDAKADIVGLKTIADINDTLADLSRVDKVVIVQLWISKLSELSTMSNVQTQWLTEMSRSNLVLTGAYEEHPEQRLNLINISQSANAALRLHRIKYLAATLMTEWNEGTVDWYQWLGAKTEAHAALIQWLKTCSPEQAKIIAWQWLNNSVIDKVPDNQAITVLLSKQDSPQLLKRLVQRKADEFSYQYFQHLPQSTESYNAIYQLDLALDNPDLASQAILSLATHYSHYEDAQQLLDKALSKPSHQWFAVAALEKVKNEELRKALLRRFASDSSAIAKAARKQLKKGESL